LGKGLRPSLKGKSSPRGAAAELTSGGLALGISEILQITTGLAYGLKCGDQEEIRNVGVKKLFLQRRRDQGVRRETLKEGR